MIRLGYKGFQPSDIVTIPETETLGGIHSVNLQYLCMDLTIFPICKSYGGEPRGNANEVEYYV